MPDTTDLGRLLDSAAGALSQSHPDLAARLAARAALAHEPPDPFDGWTGDADVDRFRCFGYLVLRGFFEPALVADLRAELVATMLAVHGDRYHDRPTGPGMPGHYTCLLGPWAPGTVDLVDGRRLVGLAERLVGGAVLPSPVDTQGIRFADSAGWHSDTDIRVRAVKLVAYLEPLDGATGALRVMPGSHRLPEEALGRHLHAIDVEVPDVPAQVLATEPGDVIAFDPLLWHASWGGRDRHQWTTLYVRDAITPSWREGLGEWFAVSTSDRDGLPEGYRPFDARWVADGSMDVTDRRFDQRHRWMFRFHRLGILDAYGVAGAFSNRTAHCL